MTDEEKLKALKTSVEMWVWDDERNKQDQEISKRINTENAEIQRDISTENLNRTIEDAENNTGRQIKEKNIARQHQLEVLERQAGVA